MSDAKDPPLKFYGEDVKEKLLKVAMQSEEGMTEVGLFAARAALRVLPYVAVYDELKHWRLGPLMSTASAIICAYLNDGNFADSYARAAETSAYAAERAAARFNADASSSAAQAVGARARGADYAARVANDAALAAANVAAADAAAAAARAAVSAARAAAARAAAARAVAARAVAARAAAARKAVDAAVDADADANDLDSLVLGVSLLAKPLWFKVSEVTARVNENWLTALDAFAKEYDKKEAHKNNLDNADLIRELIRVYNLIYNGTDARNDARAFLDKLNDFFDYANSATSPTSAELPDSAEPSDSVDPPDLTEPSIPPQEYVGSPHQLPETISQQDHLNRQPLISALASILAHPLNHQHQTIGLLGDWGIGKSTWLSLLKKELLEKYSEQTYLFGEFNAWAYEHTDNLQAGIAQEMMKALTSVREVVPKAAGHSKKSRIGKQFKVLSTKVINTKVVGEVLSPLLGLCANLTREWGRFQSKQSEQFKRNYPTHHQNLLKGFEGLNKICASLFKHVLNFILGICRSLQALVLRIWLSFWFLWRSQRVQLAKIALALLLLVGPFHPDVAHWLSKYFSLADLNDAGVPLVLSKLLAKGLWVGVIGYYACRELFKLMANPMAKELLTYLKLPNYAKHLGVIPVMRENLKTMSKIRLGRLCGKPKRMIFIVDDLDRCDHKGIVKVFEAIRLSLEIDAVTVIIAVDQHIALAALALHYKDLAEHHKLKNPRAIARDYLAKVIHLPIILSKPMGADIEKYMQKLWHASTSEADREHIKKAQDDYEKLPKERLTEILADTDTGTDTGTVAKEEPALDAADKPEVDAPRIDPESSENKPPPAFENLTSTNPAPAREDTRPPAVATLNIEQRNAFIYWVDYFGLSNPRQLKRLNNSYNLLLSCYRDVDDEPVITKLPAPIPHKLYAMMMALIVMEYLNSLEDQAVRNRLRVELFKHIPAAQDKTEATTIQSQTMSLGLSTSFCFVPTEPAQVMVGDERVTPMVTAAFHRLLAEHENLVEKVEPFVLPAIESVG